MRTAYKCRAYPDPEQQAQLGRTFGCVRLVWNKTLADRHTAYHQRGEKTSYQQTDAALTAWKKTEDLAFLSEVSSVPLQQTLRHQHSAFANFFAQRAKYPGSRTAPGASRRITPAARSVSATVACGWPNSRRRLRWPGPSTTSTSLR